MGSFVGHIDEAFFFLLISFWWMYCVFKHYIKSKGSGIPFKAHLSYPLPSKRFLPLETIIKILFPLAGLVGEICSEGLSLIDEEGNFRKLAQMQHMSIYSIFIFHGVVDFLVVWGAPVPKGADYLTASFCFLWYGLSFSYHAHMHGKEALETMIHLLPIPIMYLLSASSFCEMFFPHLIQFPLIRISCLLVLGTWFTQAAFIMYIPYPWPGSDLNPAWNQTDSRNVQAIVASFGFHIIFSFVIILLFYSFLFLFLKATDQISYKFKKLNQNNLLDTESEIEHEELEIDIKNENKTNNKKLIG